MSCMSVSLIVVFCLGIANFALHAAVLGSGHPMLAAMPGFMRALGGRSTMVAEFFLLLTAMLLVAHGWAGLVWAYAVYSALNAVSAWAILSRRI
ncbi:hypothetical protein [Erythrobacter sp.]|uniref:hypothetical protein n=1 Tax=Erythrobacter sp. TaxID=1042 RepID=UPI002ED4B01F